MNSSNIKNKKDSTKYVSHYMHNIFRFVHKTISSYCIYISSLLPFEDVYENSFFFVLISQNRLEESDFYQAQESSPRSHEKMNMDLPTTSNISATHMEVFIFEVLSYTLQIHVHVYYNKFLVKNKPLFFLSIFSFLSIFNLFLPVLQLNFHQKFFI